MIQGKPSLSGSRCFSRKSRLVDLIEPESSYLLWIEKVGKKGFHTHTVYWHGNALSKEGLTRKRRRGKKGDVETNIVKKKHGMIYLFGFNRGLVNLVSSFLPPASKRSMVYNR